MARRYKKRKQTRVAARNTNRPRLRSAVRKTRIKLDRRLIEDRRTYTPTYRPKTKSGQRAIIVTSTRPRTNRTSPPLLREKFKFPKETLICLRRKQRKEVLHAKRHTGKAGQKRPRRNQYSQTHC
jgi:hypothetical protein